MRISDHAVLAALIASLMTIGCGSERSPTEPSPNGELTVAGRAIDFHTGAAVDGLTVAFVDPISLAVRTSTTTGAGGSYRLTVSPGYYQVQADGQYAGTLQVIDGFLGDLLVRSGECTARYGVVSDARTRQPVRDARVDLGGIVSLTDANGWYRLTLGCPRRPGNGTMFFRITRAGYADLSLMAGRSENLTGLVRVDAHLTPQ